MTTSTTRYAARYADEFKGSPRYQAILAVFKAIDDLADNESISEVMIKMSHRRIFTLKA